jgi:hypothetical protein
MNIIELAQECKLVGEHPHLAGIYLKSLERFAALVAAHEREECAVIAETPIRGEQDDITMEAKDRVAKAIRARSNT